MELSQIFFNDSTALVLDVYYRNSLNELSITEVCELSGVSRPTLYKVFNRLTKKKFLVLTRKTTLSKYYSINKKLPAVKILLSVMGRLKKCH